MKKLKNSRIEELKFLNLAALLMAGAAMMFAACSSSSDEIIDKQPANPTTPKVYTMTIKASKGSNATTRALGFGDGKLNATWNAGEHVTVYNETKGAALDGYLEAQSTGEETTLSGTLDGYIDPDDILTLKFCSPAYDSQDGTLGYIASNCDYATASVTVSTVDIGNITTTGDADFANKQAIVKFAFKDKGNNAVISPSVILLSVDVNSNLETRPRGVAIATAEDAGMTLPYVSSITIPDATYSANGAGIVYLAIPDKLEEVPELKGMFEFTLTAIVGDKFYSLTKSGFPFENGQYYEITAKMFNQSNIIDLSGVKASELTNATLTLNSGDVLTGTLDGSTEDGKVKIVIAPGATVTLHSAHINGQHYDDTDFPGAGINCLGDATIVLSGENSVTNFNRYYPAILAAHNASNPDNEYTLTILGSGTLTATNPYAGAAIGGGDDMTCGNIAITSGTVTANGGSFSAAIGGGSDASCGSITISGGTVTATASNDGAGIGCGSTSSYDVSCGDITISGTASVTATGGYSAAGIGSAASSDDSANACGNISISGTCTVIATGGEKAAGIGTGEMAKCGDISITGGTVRAQGGSGAAGIGCGMSLDEDRKSECGAITIKTIKGHEADFTSVTAIKGKDAHSPIGHSFYLNCYNTCGTITFGDREVYTEGGEPSNYNLYSTPGLHFEKTTTDLGDPEENYTNNTWVLSK